MPTEEEMTAGLDLVETPGILPAGVSEAEMTGVTEKPSIGGFLKEKGKELVKALPGIAKQTGLNAAALADMVLSVPGMALGVGADLGARAVGTAMSPVTGESRRSIAQSAAATGAKVADPLSNPVHKVMAFLGYGEDYAKSDVSVAMNKFTEYLDAVGGRVEDLTGGALQREDVLALINQGMMGAGVRGIDAGIKTAIAPKKSGPGLAARGTYGEEPPAGPSPEQFRTAESLPKLTAQEHINQSLGIKTAAEREAFTAAKKKEVLAAFTKEGPETRLPDGRIMGSGKDFADYLGFLAEERVTRERAYAEQPSTPVPPTEAEMQGQYGAIADRVSTVLAKDPRDWGVQDFKILQAAAKGELPIDPKLIAAAAAVGLSQMDVLGLDSQDAIGAGVLGAAMLAVKGKGGMWDKRATNILSEPLERSLWGPGGLVASHEIPAGMEAAHATLAAWPEKSIRNYLNKHAGTATDPLKDVQIPMLGDMATWEDLWDKIITSQPAKEYLQPADGNYRTKIAREQRDMVKGVPPEEPIYDLSVLNTVPGTGNVRALRPIKDYLSHVGDYLREFVPPEKLEQYDLVRAVRETAAQDAKQAAKMEKARASGEGTVPYKAYPDGMKWVEVVEDSALKNEGDVMGHCVGGYCEAVHEGSSKIYSLRDAKGMSHVTVEVAPPRGLGDPGFDPRGSRATTTSDILQIKGKQNRAPVAQYLPYVQDFVRSGKWGEVGDAENAGLSDWQDLLRGRTPGARLDAEFKEFQKLGQRYLTDAEYENVQRSVDKQLGQDTTPLKGQRGSADPAQLARMAAVVGGALAGAALDEDNAVRGALLGAGAGVAAGLIKPVTTWNWLKKLNAPDTRVRINHLADAAELQIARSGLVIHQMTEATMAAVKDVARRDAISHWLEGDKSIKLNDAEMKVARQYQAFFAETGKQGLSGGVLNDLIENYVTHVYGPDARAALNDAYPRGPNMSPNTKFGEARRGPPTIAEVNKVMAAKGLEPITADIAQIAAIYGRSVARALANKTMLDSLKELRTDNAPLVAKLKDAPAGYVEIPHPQLRGSLVHPDIAPSMRFLFEQSNPHAIVRGIEMLNIATKRIAVSASGFHMKALFDAAIGATRIKPAYVAGGAALGAAIGSQEDQSYIGGAAGAALGLAAPIAMRVPAMLRGTDPFLRALKGVDNGMAKYIDLALQGGLKFSLEKSAPAVEDIGQGFYMTLKDLQQWTNKQIPGAGTATFGSIAKVNALMDKYMWERMHAALKLNTFMEKYEVLLGNNAKAHAADPLKVQLMKPSEVAKAAASFTNDIYGGLNWRMIAEGAKTKWGRDFALAVLSPTGRRVNQLLLFAPDWTLSTTRAAMKAIGEGSGMQGLLEPRTVADLHRQYIARSALYYAAAADALNLTFTGKHFWENEPQRKLKPGEEFGVQERLDASTYVDLGDGRKIQLSKHATEPLHWFSKPSQQGLNKLGFWPREIANQLLGSQYLSASGHAPRMDPENPVAPGAAARAGHVLKQFVPIAAQQFDTSGQAGIAGALGFPIHGTSNEERARLKEQRKAKRKAAKAGGVGASNGREMPADRTAVQAKKYITDQLDAQGPQAAWERMMAAREGSAAMELRKTSPRDAMRVMAEMERRAATGAIQERMERLRKQRKGQMI